MTFQEIRIIVAGPCITNQLRDVNTMCRRNWYIAAHVWKIYDFKIEVVPLIITYFVCLIEQIGIRHYTIVCLEYLHFILFPKPHELGSGTTLLSDWNIYILFYFLSIMNWDRALH